MNTVVKILIITCVFTLSDNLSATNNCLVTYTKEANVGDRNQVLGIANALKELLPDKNFQQKNIDVADKQNFLADISTLSSTDTKVVIIAAGTPTIDALKKISRNPNIIIAYSAHQLTEDIAHLKDITDIIALPKHALTARQIQDLTTSKTKVVTTSGVAHSLTTTDIQAEYQKNKSDIPVAEGYMAVILGGDAPTPEGKILHYSAEEAKKLALYIDQHFDLNKNCLLIINGPRTGKHIPDTEQVIEDSHRHGSIDFVTTAFIQTLEQKRYVKDRHFKLFDFQYGAPSFYKTILGVLLKTSGPLFVAGESSSMVSEAADCLPSGLVTAYFNNAMNDNHEHQCVEENKIGRISILSLNANQEWELKKAAQKDTSSDIQSSAAKVIAQAIKNII